MRFFFLHVLVSYDIKFHLLFTVPNPLILGWGSGIAWKSWHAHFQICFSSPPHRPLLPSQCGSFCRASWFPWFFLPLTVLLFGLVMCFSAAEWLWFPCFPQAAAFGFSAPFPKAATLTQEERHLALVSVTLIPVCFCPCSLRKIQRYSILWAAVGPLLFSVSTPTQCRQRAPPQACQLKPSICHP